MAESGLVYLLTGSNRGIGRAALGDLLLRPSTTVVAAVRDIEHESATTLSSLPLAEGSKLHMVALNEKEASINADTLPERLRALGITHIDIVVANGGGSVAFRPVLEARADELASDFETNVLAPMRLFQACWPFLAKSDGTDTRRKKFIYVSSSTGSIGVQMMMEHFPSTGYGTSKAAGNWLAASTSLEHKKDGLKVGIFHPGFAKTGLGGQAAVAIGMEPPMTATESGVALLKHIDELEIEKSGTFDSFHGKPLPW